jgi:hypothetical protein
MKVEKKCRASLWKGRSPSQQTYGENILWSHSHNSHATMLLFKKKILSGRKRWNKFVDVHKIYLYNPYNFQNQILNVRQETKKTNCYVNSIILTFYLFVKLFMFDLSFLLLLVYFEFDSENSRNCKDISCVHIKFCSKFFCHLNFEILQVVSWYHFRYGITGYLPGPMLRGARQRPILILDGVEQKCKKYSFKMK